MAVGPLPEAPVAAVVEADRRTRRGARRALVIAGGLGLALLLLVMLLLIGVLVGPAAVLTGLVLAVIPVPIYVGLVLLIDRFEPEPPGVLAWTFFWGASAATLIAFILNSVGQELVSSSWGTDIGEIYGGSVSAPVVEEVAKAAALFGVYRWRRSELDGILDGIVYAAMVGLGFAMTENVLYYGTALAEDGEVPAEGVFFMRGVLSPFAHPVFTAMTGIGLGLAVMSPSRSRRVAYIAGGLLLAMFLHSLWNTSAGAGVAFLGVYFLIMVPIFALLVAMVVLARKREARMVWDHLQLEVESGTLSAGEVAVLAQLRPRRRALKEAKRAGADSRRRRAAYHEAATALAYHRNRMRRGVAGARGEAEERALASSLTELRAGLDSSALARDQGHPLPPWAPRAMVAPANWYPDPSGEARLRYWDGSAWTGHVAQ